MIYDIIGDIHGHADKLQKLLRKLHYQVRDGIFHHNNRKAVCWFLHETRLHLLSCCICNLIVTSHYVSLQVKKSFYYVISMH
jgi:hypothetical protein